MGLLGDHKRRETISYLSQGWAEMPPKLGTWEQKTYLRNGCAQRESVRLGAEGLDASHPSHTAGRLRGRGGCLAWVLSLNLSSSLSSQ